MALSALLALLALLQAVLLQPPVECAPAEAESFGSLPGVASEPCEAFLDQKLFDLFEAHVFDLRRDIWLGTLKTEIVDADPWTCGHQNSALDRLIQFPDVARPGMGQ